MLFAGGIMSDGYDFRRRLSDAISGVDKRRAEAREQARRQQSAAEAAAAQKQAVWERASAAAQSARERVLGQVGVEGLLREFNRNVGMPGVTLERLRGSSPRGHQHYQRRCAGDSDSNITYTSHFYTLDGYALRKKGVGQYPSKCSGVFAGFVGSSFGVADFNGWDPGEGPPWFEADLALTNPFEDGKGAVYDLSQAVMSQRIAGLIPAAQRVVESGLINLAVKFRMGDWPDQRPWDPQF
jgi:hypothetical protein